MESTNNQNVRSENDQPLGKSITTGPNSSSSARVAVPEPTDTKPFNPNSVSSTPLPNYPNVENSVGIDFSRDYDFKQVKDLLPTLDENAFKQIDPDYMAYLGAVENELSKYVPPVVSNINSRLPGRATNNYNPVAQALPTRSSSSRTQPSSFGSSFQAAMGRVSQQPSANKSLIGHVSPTYFSAKAAAFDRYYKHPKFNELGFHPYVNNEAYYNANSTIMDDGVRMFGQAANQFGSAFVSTYRSIGDLFDEDNYWTGKDLKTAGEFMSATEIGMSSRGGVGGFMNNLVLNSAYTFGIIGNILLEDVVLNAVTAGGKSGLTALTIGTKLKNLGKGIAGMAKIGAKVPDYFSISKAAGASTQMLKRLGDINVARGFYNTVKAGGKLAANIFTPHTLAGIRKTRTAANAADGAANIAKGSNVFFDMYKDFRELNFALGEAKLEGGIVYQEQFTTALAKIMQREGVNAPTEEMMAEARDNASKASFYTTILNAPFIYLSNKIVLGTMLKGFNGNRFLRETFEEGSGILKKRVVRSSASRSAKAGKKAGETAGKAGPVFEDVGEGLFSGFRRMRALGAKGTARQFAQGSLRYFAANITEGTQELYQEAVSAGTQDYYSSLASDPTMPSHLAFNAAFANGVGSQISAEGFHTFLSGFFMGGVVQGPQKFLTSTIPNLYKTRIAKDEEYLALKDRKDKYVEKAVASLNEMTEIYGEESAVDIFSLKKLRINGINEASKGQVEDEMNGDILSYFNKEDFKRFQMINDKVSNGSADLLLEHFNELDTLSDEDLAGYFGEENTAENAKKLRSRLSEVKGDIQAVKDSYEQSNLDLVNPFENFAQFKKGSKEYSDAFGKYVAFEHARYLYVYTKDTFRKSTKRFNDIFKSLESDPILPNLQASDLTVLLDPKATKNEITILKKEIASMEGSEEFAEEIEFKRKKVKALEAFVEILQDPANLKDDEAFNRRLEYTKKLRPAFLEYIQLLADSRDDFVNRDVINKTLQKIVDYGYLKGSAIQYSKALEVLLNPQVLSDLTERMAKLNPYDKAQREKFVKGLLEAYVDNENINAFFNELFELGVTTDPAETVEFMRTGDIEKLTLFYTDAGQVNPIDDFELQTKIDFAKGQFKKIQEALNPKEESDQTAETKERVESKADEILKELGFTVYEQLELTNEDPYLNRLILAKHRQYEQKEKALGKEPLELNDWLASPNLGGKVVTAFEIARQIFANRIAKKELSNEMLEGINVDNLESMLADVEAGTNFEKWLNSADTLNDEGLINALEAADASYNDLLTLPKISSPVQQNNIASVSEVIVFDANGNKQVTYTLNDAQGNPLTADQLDALDIKNNAGIFLDKSSALRAFNKYSQSIEDTTAWEFAGEEIYHGAVIIERSTGKRFVVLSTPQMKDSSSVLKIVPEEFANASNKVKNRKSKVITTSDFDSYAKEGVNINIAPEDTAKLSALDFISIYPKDEMRYLKELLELSDENITGRFGQKNSQDNANQIRSRISERITEIEGDNLTAQQRRQQNKQRLNVIFKSLTQEELSQLSLEIKINDQGVNKPYQFEVLDSNGNKVVKSNPQIRRTGEGYSVQVRVMNAGLQKRINQILNDAGLSPIDFTFDNGIAFLPNGGYKFFNDRNVEVDPRTMDQYTANQIFTENTSDLKGIQEKFAINAALSAALSGKPDGIYTIKQLGEDLRFAIDVSLNFSENDNRIQFSDIEYGNLTVGGKTVVIRQKDSQIKILTNSTEFKDETARGEFISKLRNEIKGQFRDNMVGMGEYMLLLRLPDGQLQYIPFDRRPMSDKELSDVVQYAMNESVRLRQNEKKLSDVKLREEVDKVNKEITRRLYIINNKKDSSIFIDMELNPFTDSYKFGFIQIKGKQGNTREMGADSSTMTELYDKTPTEFLTGLINAANDNKKFTDLVGEVSRDSFYPQTPRFDKDTSTATEALENYGLTTGVEPTVFKFSGPFIRNNGTTTQAVRNTPLAASNTKVDSAPAPKADPVSEETSSVQEIVSINVEDSPSVLSKLSNKEIAKIARNTNNEAIQFLGKLVSKTSVNVEGGRAEQEVYENGVVQRIFTDDGSKVQRVTDHNGKVYGVPLINLTMDAKEAGLLFDGQKGFSLTEKQITEFFNSKFAQPLPAKPLDNSTKEALTRNELLQQLQSINNQIQKRKVALVNAKVPGEKRDNDPELLRLFEELNKIDNELNPGTANKLVDGSLSYSDITAIDEFVEWAKTNLPDFISISDINELGSNLKKGGVRVGAFIMSLKGIGQGVEGNIYTGASNPFKYHEAFHAVFRMLLTDTQIEQYLKIGKKELLAKLKSEGKTLKGEMQRLKNSAAIYEGMSDARLEQELIEEYLADRFEEFKTDRKGTQTDSIIKAFFNRLMEIIRSVFKQYSPRQLETLFQKIDAGKFKDSSVQQNRYTESTFGNVSLEADKLIPVEKVSRSTRYLDSTTAKQLIADMSGYYIRKFSEAVAPIDKNQILDEVIEDFTKIYDPISDNNDNLEEYQLLALFDINKALRTFSSEVKDGITEYLDLVTVKVADRLEELEENFDEEGDRTVQDWDKSQELIGGYGSLSAYVRKYIATTTMSATDIFGREMTMPDGRPYATTVDAFTAYSGMVKAARNTSDQFEMLRKMVKYSKYNPQTAAVINRFLNDVGISEEELMSSDQPVKITGDGNLFQRFMAAFENYTVDYKIVDNLKADGRVKVYSALNANNASLQLSRWGNNYVILKKQFRLDPQFKQDAIDDLNEIAEFFNPVETITDELLSKRALQISIALSEKVGVMVNPLYVEFSLLQNVNSKTKEQAKFLNDNADAKPMTSIDVGQMANTIEQDKFLFKRSEGILSRLENIAQGNAVFDENILLSQFKDANGNLVNAHQAATFHLKKIYELNKAGVLEDMQSDLSLQENPILKNNPILSNPLIGELTAQNGFKVTRINGRLQRTDRGTIDSTTYGDYTSEQFLSDIIAAYFSNVEPNTGNVQVIEDSQGNKQALADTLIRVMEASNTGDLVTLPIIKTIDDNGKIAKQTVEIFKNRIENEFDRIKQLHLSAVTNEITSVIEGYNTTYKNDEGDIQFEGRGFKFFNNGMYMGSELQSSLEGVFKGKSAEELADLTLETALKEVNSSVAKLNTSISKSLNSQYASWKATLSGVKLPAQVTSGAMNEGGVVNRSSNDLLNLKSNNADHNLKQIFLSDLINTEAINEILLGDQAVSTKNAVDKVKRAKMQNAAGKSAAHLTVDAKLGINHTMTKMRYIQFEEPTIGSIYNGEDIDRADAQSYYTVDGFIHTFFGFGKLTQQQADVAMKIKQGIDITREELFGAADKEGLDKLQGMFNSKKIVYGDGQVYIKTSAFMLTPQFTSTKESGYTEAIPGMEQLHNLRLIMERFEAESMTDSQGGDTGEIIPVIASPISASKMKKENVNPLDVVSDFSRFDEVKSVEIDADFMRLQVINPSNKGAVTDPTQIKTLISSELLTSDSESKTIKKINIAGQELSLKEIKDEYHKKQNAKVRLNFRGRRNLIINFSVADAFSELNKAKETGKVSVNLYAMLKFAEKSNKASSLSSNILEIFSVENGEAKYDPNMPISIDKFEQIFLNFFSNAINAKLNGDKFTLVSDYGHYVYRRVFSVDQNGNPDRSEVVRRSVATKQGLEPINKSTPGNISMLAEAIEKAGGEGVIILDRLRPNVKEYDENGKFTGRIFSEVTIPAQSGEVYEHLDMKGVEIPSVVSEFFSTRIPTQDKHSASAARVVDFMPAFYGSVAMFPAELVQVSGSDFDVDAVYAHFKQYFEVDGKFYEYGKATNDKGRFFEYQRFLNEEVNKKGSTLNLALALYKENAAQIEIAKTGTEEFELNFEAVTKMISEIEESYTSKKTRGLFSKDAFVAAAMIGMPVSFEQFQAYEKKYGETPSEAELNNRILDIKIGLLANEYTSDKSATPDENGNMISIAHEAASLKTLKSVLQTLSDKHAQIRDRISEENVNVNSLDGKTSSFKNNKEGAGLIGNAVIPNNILSLLSEFNALIETPIIIDGAVYSNFNEQFQRGTTERTQVVVDEIITAATDNAKERLITKLSLTRENIAIAVVMAKLGISPTFIFEFLSAPSVSKVFSTMSKDNMRFEKAFKEVFKTSSSDKIFPRINSEVINDNYTSARPSEELGDFLRAMHILSQEVLQSIAPLSLTKNLGRDLSNIDRVLEALEDMTPTSKNPAESNQFIKGSEHFSDSFYESYIESIKEISEIADSVFVQRTEKGKEVTNLINATVSPFLTADQKLKIKRDIVSYLTLSQYMLGYSQARASLSNDFLYGTGEFTPGDVVNRLREYSDQQSEENFFLDVFLRVQEITDEENTSGISIIQGNTLIQLTDAQKVDLQNDFMRLYDNPATRVDAMHLVHYLMVKDALQYQYGGILDAIPVAVLGEFNQAVIDASQNPSSEQYVDFRRYFASASAAEYLQKIYKPSEKGIQIKDDGKTAIVSYSAKSKNEATIRRIQDVKKYRTPPIALNIVVQNQDTFYALKEYIPGKYAVYTRFQGRGSLDHNPIGFIFDGQNPRPTLSSIDAQVNKVNNQPVEPAPAPTDIDAAVAAKLEGLQDPNNNVIVDGKNLTIEKPSQQPTELITTTIAGMEITYRVNNNLQNADGSKRFASTNRNNQITLNPVTSTQELFDYMEGKEGGITSQQKLLVLREVEKQGYPMSRVKQILSTKKLANSFLLLHEQDHINNNDRDVYFKNGRDLLTPDKIVIEARATVNALQQLESQSTAQPVQESTEIDQDIMDQLDSFDAVYTEGAVFKDTPNEVRYEALFNRINTPENKENLKKHALGSIKSLTTFMRAFQGTQQEAEEYMRKCFGLKF